MIKQILIVIVKLRIMKKKSVVQMLVELMLTHVVDIQVKIVIPIVIFIISYVKN